MARDRQLARNFWLHEFPGWELAGADDVAQLEETVARVLQPLRTAMGARVHPTSWIRWRDGSPRTGAHEHAGTVDFVVARGLTRDAWAWGQEYLVPGGYIGRWIYEPERSDADGTAQGEHVHVAPRAAMIELFGDPTIQVLEETEEGRYVLARTAAGLGTGVLALLGALLFFLARRPGALA